jgi:hypothetical protein
MPHEDYEFYMSVLIRTLMISGMVKENTAKA